MAACANGSSCNTYPILTRWLLMFTAGANSRTCNSLGKGTACMAASRDQGHEAGLVARLQPAVRCRRACMSAWHASASCRTSRASLRACRCVSASIAPPPSAPPGRGAPLPGASPRVRWGPGGCSAGRASAAALPLSGLWHVARNACSAASGRARRRWCSTAAAAAAGARRTTCRCNDKVQPRPTYISTAS